MNDTTTASGASGAAPPGVSPRRVSGAWRAPRQTVAVVCALWLGLWWIGAEVLASQPLEPMHVPIVGGLQGKTCYECHIRGKGIVLRSQERPPKYSIASAFLTYQNSPHGRLRAMGDTNAPTCEDCHLTREWSDILPQQLPDSPINPANLPRICARCHGPSMLNANVAAGSMHLELGSRSIRLGKPLDVRYGFLPGITKLEKTYYIGPIDVLAYIAYMFLALTVGTLSVMGVYVVLDLFRRMADHRRHLQDSEHET